MPWFVRVARISYFFLNAKGETAFHAEYFDRARDDSVLGAFGHKNELFIVLKCANILVGAILGPAIKMHDSPTNEGVFCRYIFDGNSWTLLKRCVKEYLEKGSCFVGGSTVSRPPAEGIVPGKTEVIRGVVYHTYDFVYLKPRGDDVSRIAQIRVLRNERVRVSLMTRGAPNGAFGEVRFSGSFAGSLG